MDKRDHVQRTALADVFLDTFPYNAGGTAADTLWAGVPVITHPGQVMASRMGLTAVTAMGFPELGASDWAEYKELAVALATDPLRLRSLQRELSAARASSALFDTRRYESRADPFAATRTAFARHLAANATPRGSARA